MPFTPEENAEAEEDEGRSKEEAERDLVRSLIGAVKLWQQCEHRICRRMRRCVETQTCQTRYADDILQIKRTWLVPYLRKCYPDRAVGRAGGNRRSADRSGAAAAQARETRQQARKDGRPVPRKRRRKRVPRQPLYVPPDFAGEVGRGES